MGKKSKGEEKLGSPIVLSQLSDPSILNLVLFLFYKVTEYSCHSAYSSTFLVSEDLKNGKFSVTIFLLPTLSNLCPETCINFYFFILFFKFWSTHGNSQGLLLTLNSGIPGISPVPSLQIYTQFLIGFCYPHHCACTHMWQPIKPEVHQKLQI